MYRKLPRVEHALAGEYSIYKHTATQLQKVRSFRDDAEPHRVICTPPVALHAG